MLLLLALPGAAAYGHASSAAQLVSLRRNEGQLVQTVSVNTDGHGEVGIFIGEATGIRYRSFTLNPAHAARLRQLVAETARLHREIYLHGTGADPFVVDRYYVVAIDDRSFATDSSPAPKPLKALAADLSAVIDRVAHGIADSRGNGATVPGE